MSDKFDDNLYDFEDVLGKEDAEYEAPMGGSKSERVYRKPGANAKDDTYDVLDSPVANFNAANQRTVAICCPKGGVGKSTLAKELAYAFASRRYISSNGIPLRVLIVDADWGHPTQKILFNVQNEKNSKRISSWISIMATQMDKTGVPGFYNSRFINDYIVKVTDNLHLLTLTNGSLDANMITEEMVRSITQSLTSTNYDLIIYDNRNNGVEDSRNVAVMEACDTILEVLTAELPTMNNVREDIKALSAGGFDVGRIRFVLNHAPVKDPEAAEVTAVDIENVFQAPIITEIPRNEQMSNINNRAEAAVIKNPNSPFSTAVYEIAEYLIPAPQEKKRGFFSGLFRRR